MPKVAANISAFSVYKNEKPKKNIRNKIKRKPVHLKKLKLLRDKNVSKSELFLSTRESKLKKTRTKVQPVADVLQEDKQLHKNVKSPKNNVAEAPRDEKVNKTVKSSKRSILGKIDRAVNPQLMTGSSEKKQIKHTKASSGMINKDPSLEAFKLLQWMLSPLSCSDFFQSYWEQKPVHIKRQNPTYYKNILSSATLDKVLRNNNLFYSRNVDVVSYENGVKEVFNLEGRASASALWDFYSNGCSIRVLNPQTYDKRVHLLLATLQEYFGTMVGANVYLTPPASQGFAPHYDDIEAFVVQLEGCKYWKLYKPKDEHVLARYSSPNFQHSDLGDPIMEVTLKAGDLLYFPRGVIHEGRTHADAHSLHITVSMYQQTAYVDLLKHILLPALDRASQQDVEFRKGLPIDYLKICGTSTTKDATLIKKKVRDLVLSLVNYVDIDSAADQLGKKFMIDSMPPVLSKDEAKRTCRADGSYLENGKVCNRGEISPNTKIRLVRYYCVRVVREEGKSALLYYNTDNAHVYHGEEEQWLELDGSMIPAIETLQKSFPGYIEVDELPMEDELVKMQLVADLWEHGLLITERSLLTE